MLINNHSAHFSTSYFDYQMNLLTLQLKRVKNK